MNVISETPLVNDSPDAHVTYGGQVGYLWHGMVGGEFLADFAPNVGFDSLVLSKNPQVNSYMGNLIVSIPFGGDQRFQPYFSGGFGSIGLRADVFTLPDINGNVSTVSSNEHRWGSDLGGGIFAFANRWGVRGDVRWFRASTDNNFSTDNTPAQNVTQALLSDLRFWRGTVGVAFRW